LTSSWLGFVLSLIRHLYDISNLIRGQLPRFVGQIWTYIVIILAQKIQQLKLGLIGCGRVAENRHLPALQSLPDVQVVAISDIDNQRLKQVADRFDIKARYSDFRLLIEDPGIDAIAVCVPPNLHADIGMVVLEAGKHLFIEKPLALSLDQCDQLIIKAAPLKNKVMVGFNLRWHRLLHQARQAVEDETMGQVAAIRTAFTSGIRHRRALPGWRCQPTLGGGAIMEIAIHHFDLLYFLLRDEIEEVFAIRPFGEGVDETVTVIARTAGGVQINSLFSESTGDNHDVEIYGPAGRLQVSCYRFDGLEFFSTSSYPGSIRSRLRRTKQLIADLPQGLSSVRQGGDYVASYKEEWRHFISCIQNDETVASTLEDGRRALQVALAAIQSVSSGQPVKVTQAQREIASSIKAFG
jgi:myo-inositol 2-dehydrogenase/D-chiro-inositol 1-dehydrogenase